MADTVNLQKSYSKMNESLVKLYDDSGVHRSTTVPYIDGQSMEDHIGALKVALSEVGGATNNLVLTHHHSDGKGWGSGDGHTVAYNGDKLRTTVIPHDSKPAKAALDAAQTHLNNLKTLLGKDNPTMQTAQGQLDLAKKTDAEGMNLMDLGVLLTQIMYRPTQLVAKMHSGTKPGGHAAHLRGPVEAAPEQQEAPAQGDEEEKPEDNEQPVAQPQQAQAPAAPQAAPSATPAQGQ